MQNFKSILSALSVLVMEFSRGGVQSVPDGDLTLQGTNGSVRKFTATIAAGLSFSNGLFGQKIVQQPVY